jgi:hypothetical protein
MAQPTQSQGHIAVSANGRLEYFIAPDGALYRAPTANELDADGYRQGARFECAAVHIERALLLLGLRSAA